MARVQLTKAQKAKRRRRISRQIKGGIIAFFAAVGIITIVSVAVNSIKNVVSQEDDKETFARLVSPLVALDPVPFDSIDKANINLLSESAVWSAFENEDITKYQKTENNHLIIPVTDVSRYFTRLYGTSVSMIKRKNFTISNLTYEYDVEHDAYILPTTGWAGKYTAVVTDIKTSGNTKVLTVGYVKYDPNAGITAGDANEQNIVKSMEYVLIKEDADWHIYAVRYPEVPEE